MADPDLPRREIQIYRVHDCLLIAIQDDLDDGMVIALQDSLMQRIVSSGARGVLIDISALEIVDTFTGRMLAGIARMASLLDADSVLVGMRPAVAITLVELGMRLEGVKTALNVDRGLELIQRSLRPVSVDAG